jgi:hypothetical protein
MSLTAPDRPVRSLVLLFDESCHTRAWFPLGFQTQRLAALLEPLDVLLGLFRVNSAIDGLSERSMPK